MGKTPVPEAPFGRIHASFTAIHEQPQFYPVLIALQMYSAALREVEPLLRFSLFCPRAKGWRTGCETISRETP
jgi:hypothetical protein